MNIVREYINEKFTEDSDPVRDMGIGMIHKIKEWLDRYNIKKYTINDDLSIDVEGEVNLRQKLSKKLPEYIQFNEVTNTFNVMECGLTTLKGCPRKVGYDFHCTSNKLKNLIGAPEVVGHHFCCGSNRLISLKGIPKRILGDFYCTYTNGIKFTEKEIRNLTNTNKIHL